MPIQRRVASNGTHTLAVLAPDTVENIRAGQTMHALTLLAPVTIEYVPAEQFVHESPEPVTVLYCPAGHAVQGPPFGPVYPASHTQLLSNPLAAGAREFAGHRLQFALPSGDHCPSGHGRHVSFPTAP